MVYYTITVFAIIIFAFMLLTIKLINRQWKYFNEVKNLLEKRESLVFTRLMYQKGKVGAVPQGDQILSLGGNNEALFGGIERITDEDEYMQVR